MGPRRQDVLHAALVVAVVAAVVLIAPPGARGAEATPAWALPYDDPYIHLRYAQALVQGVPGQWSAGAPSTGATSPLYGLLLAPWVALTDDLALLSWAARGTGAACLVWAGAEASAWARTRGLGAAWAGAAAAVTVAGSALGFSGLAGMDTPLAAAVLLRWARTGGAGWAALAPLVRPDLAVLTVWSTVTGLRTSGPRAAVLLLPGAAWAALCRATTGEWAPAGAIGKSITSVPYATFAARAEAWVDRGVDPLGLAYLGGAPVVFAPPLGLLAVLALVRLCREADLRRLLGAWVALVLLSPLSSHLAWQLVRHHHPAFAAAGLVGVLGLASWVHARRWGPVVAAVLVGGVVGPQALRWRAFHAESAAAFWQMHGAATDWLAAHPGTSLATHEAGIFALTGLGPSVDVLGLGTPAFTRAAIHREGAVLEALGRRGEPLAVAAFDPATVDLGGLLGEPIVVREHLVLAPIDRALLARVADGARLDFGYLPDEAAHRMVWDPPPLSGRATLALAAALPDGAGLAYHGCRPVRGRLGVELGPGVWELRWTFLAGRTGTLSFADGDADGPRTPLGEVTGTGEGAWVHTRNTLSAGWLWLENVGGPACVESLR